jgi:hypothetical protein
MKTLAIYDDRLRPDDEARTFLGVDRFSAIRFRKRTLADHARQLLTDAGVDAVVTVADDEDVAAVLRDRLAGDRLRRVVLLPSAAVFRDAAAARTLVAKMLYVDEPYAVRTAWPGAPTPLFVDAAQARVLLVRPPWLDAEAPLPGVQLLPDQAGLTDLTDRDRLIDLLAGTFDARHFNSIRHDGLVVTKRSADVAKMRREYAFYRQLVALGGPLRLFFLEPLAFREGPGWAEYDTERLGVPDGAVQWIHGAIDPPRFRLLLGKLGEFLRRRPRRPAAGGQAAAERFYLDKVDERLAQLRTTPAWPATEALLARCSAAVSPERLAERLRTQWRRFAAQRPAWEEAVAHGDLCLSNILFCRQSRLVKFIDPRGAETVDGLWLDATYDLAKLSHSILGDYDFINHDLCALELDRGLHVRLEVHAPARAEQQADFLELLAGLGYAEGWVRACEATLFLSMLPLHADVPKKVVAFALTADAILTRLEAG